MRKVDGWQTLDKPIEPMPLDLAARSAANPPRSENAPGKFPPLSRHDRKAGLRLTFRTRPRWAPSPRSSHAVLTGSALGHVRGGGSARVPAGPCTCWIPTRFMCRGRRLGADVIRSRSPGTGPPRPFSRDNQRSGFRKRFLLAGKRAIQPVDPLPVALRLARDAARSFALPVIGPFAGLPPDMDLLGVETPAPEGLTEIGFIHRGVRHWSRTGGDTMAHRSPPQACPLTSSPPGPSWHRAGPVSSPGPRPATWPASRAKSLPPATASPRGRVFAGSIFARSAAFLSGA